VFGFPFGAEEFQTYLGFDLERKNSELVWASIWSGRIPNLFGFRFRFRFGAKEFRTYLVLDFEQNNPEPVWVSIWSGRISNLLGL
jgi:hypothetical protein